MAPLIYMIQTTRPHCTAVALTFQALLSVHDGRFGKTAVGIQCIGKLGTSKLISANSDIEHSYIWNVNRLNSVLKTKLHHTKVH